MFDLPSLSLSPAALGVLFLYGLVTSLHCVGMCGGLVLSASLSASRKEGATGFAHSAAGYHCGRLVSYTAMGALAGGLGQILGLPHALRAALPMIGGLLVCVFGLNQLGLLKRFHINLAFCSLERLDKLFGNTFHLGLATALLPCGPLQAMQLFCLGSGSMAWGALAMASYTAGTIPLLLAFGGASRYLGRRWQRFATGSAAVIMIVLGASMVGRGMSLAGWTVRAPASPADGTVEAWKRGNLQILVTEFDPSGYPPIRLKAGIPVHWIMHMDKNYLGTCSANIEIAGLGINRSFVAGDNLLEFTPARPGRFAYHSWCGMIANTITVQ
ncbi:MAG: sulfite exporter TauE/SafE family protein [Holophaga sp.]|nr:sulfite exporter TauE/SafE family protein [Holophaga sp.]